MLRITNISCSANLNTILDLKTLHHLLEGSIYKYPKFNGLILYNKSPKCTIIYYGTGKVVVVGASDEIDAEIGANTASYLLEKVGIESNVSDFKIHNIAATANLGHQLKLEEFKIKYKEFIQHDTELFPGVFLRHPSIKPTVILFYQGKVILTGGKERSEIEEGFTTLKTLITNDLIRL